MQFNVFHFLLQRRFLTWYKLSALKSARADANPAMLVVAGRRFLSSHGDIAAQS
jgi:hypothetical protein